jgi:hypothetical protein
MITFSTQQHSTQHHRTRSSEAAGERVGTEMLLDEALSRTRQTEAE